MLAGHDIVCVGADPWRSMPRRRHRVMASLARANRVLWVEPPVSLLTPLRDRSQWPALRGWRPGVRHVQDGLYTVSLLDPLPLSRFGGVRAANAWWQRLTVRGAARRLGFERPILWLNFNWGLADYIGALDERLVVYDCWDKHTGFVRNERDRAVADAIEVWERRIVRRADVVFTASEALSEHVRALGARVAPIMAPNAAELPSTADSLMEPADMAAIPRPRLGQLGAISPKVDLALLAAVAVRRPDWSLVLVGPVQVETDRAAIARLRALPNVHLLGARPAAQLPAYAAALNVGLIPFRLDAEEVQYTSFPNRFWEYLAAGRPIVSVPLAGLDAYDGFVRRAEGSDGFVAAIEAALADSDTAAVEARRRLAAANTWDARAAQMAEAVQRALVLPEGKDSTRREAVG